MKGKKVVPITRKDMAKYQIHGGHRINNNKNIK